MLVKLRKGEEKMAEFAEFVASTPVVVEATEEKVFDKYWLSNLRIMAGEPTKPVRMMAAWTPARDITIQVPVEVPVEGGEEGETETVMTDVVVKELQKNAQPKRLVIEDLFGAAAEDANLAVALETVLAAIKVKADSEGLL